MGEPKKITEADLARMADYNANLEDTLSMADRIGEAFKDQGRHMGDLISGAGQTNKLLSLELKISEKIADSKNKEGMYVEGANKWTVKQLQAEKILLKVAQSRNKILVQTKKGFEQVNDQAQTLISNATGFVDKLPGGKAISKLVGLDTLSESFTLAMTNAAKGYAKALIAGQGPMAALKAGMMGFNAAALMNPVLLIVVAAASLAVIFTKLSHTAHELSTATGLTYAQTKNIVKASNEVVSSFDNQLSLQKDILAVMTETVKEFGVMGMMSAKQAGAVSDIGIAFGYGAEQAGKVNTAFMRMGATADEAANTQRDLAAEAMKAGVSVGAVTADIAENSKATSKYFGGNVKALKKAAIEAAKMGVSLSTMAKVSDGLLDFEKSISAQFELQALTGKNMNLDGARRLALEGDIAGATAAVLDQVGSIAEFDNMSYLGRKKLAEATGMDVDELQKSLIIKSKMGNLDSAQLATMNGLGLSAAEMTNMSSEDLQKKLASKQATEKMAAQFAAMKATLVNALMPAAEALMSIFSAMSPIFKVLGVAIKVALLPLTLAVKTIGFILGLMEKFKVVTAVVGGFLLGNYLQTKLATEEQRTAIVLQVRNKLGLIASNALKLIGLGTDQAGTAEKKAGFLMSTYEFAKQTAINVVKGAGYALELAINVAKGIGIALSTGAIAPLMAAAGAAISAAIPAIFTGFGMIPFGLGIPLAFATVAGLIGLVASMSKGDDVMSGPAGGGGGGYGSRVMFGPEGAISFNNKDTIVAGTDLFGQANDAVFAPKGALRMDDGAINADMPDPPEAKIVGIANQSVVKLSMGIAAAMGLAVAPAFMSALALSMPLITISIVGAIVAASALTMPMLATTIIVGFSAALIAAMPIIAATIVGAAVTAAAMTALIPKPVMILNPVLPTFETNPVMMMGAMLGGIGNLLGGGKSKASDKEDPVVAKLDQVILAIQNMEINMDGQKVGAMTRLADTFRKG